jgi:hypothetical protein
MNKRRLMFYEAGGDYLYIKDEVLRSALKSAEKAWLEKAERLYGRDTFVIWEEDILPRFLHGKLKPEDTEDIEDFCPELLTFLPKNNND